MQRKLPDPKWYLSTNTGTTGTLSNTVSTAISTTYADIFHNTAAKTKRKPGRKPGKYKMAVFSEKNEPVDIVTCHSVPSTLVGKHGEIVVADMQNLDGLMADLSDPVDSVGVKTTCVRYRVVVFSGSSGGRVPVLLVDDAKRYRKVEKDFKAQYESGLR